jgi:hypothetical protein
VPEALRARRVNWLPCVLQLVLATSCDRGVGFDCDLTACGCATNVSEGRGYHRGGAQPQHVDRYDTHVASAIVQLDQQMDAGKDWPVVITDHEGEAHCVPLKAGQALL